MEVMNIASIDAAHNTEFSYRWLDTPVGSLLFVTSVKGLVRVAFHDGDKDSIVERVQEELGKSAVLKPGELSEVASQVESYFAGKLKDFNLPLDYSLTSGFRQTVADCLTRIPFGEVRSYKEVAEMANNPKAVRAVGTGCAKNPIPLVVPCHRVVRTGGSLGGYAGGLGMKIALLEHEGATGWKK